MSADAPKRGYEAGLPKATISFVSTVPKSPTCEVLVDGVAVAYLPITGLEFAQDAQGLGRIKFGLLAADVHVGSLGDQLEGTHT